MALQIMKRTILVFSLALLCVLRGQPINVYYGGTGLHVAQFNTETAVRMSLISPT